MKKIFKKYMKNEKGMTLIELLAVIVIIAIIAAIAIPAIGNLIDNSRNNAVKADFQNVLNAGNLYFAENNSAVGATFTDTTTGASNYVEDKGSIISYTVTKTENGSTIAGTATVNGVVKTLPAKTKAELDDMTADQIGALANASSGS